MESLLLGHNKKSTFIKSIVHVSSQVNCEPIFIKTFRDAIQLHQVVLEKVGSLFDGIEVKMKNQVAEGENHTLLERRDELNATMMEQGCTREMDKWGTVWSQVNRKDE